MLSDMDMDDIESEESDCFSTVSSEESSEEVSYKAWDLHEDQSDEFRISPQSSVRVSKNNFLQKLYFREIGGFYAPHHSKNFNRMQKPSFQRIKLADILPLSASKLNHVFLGMSKCGQFLLSYTYTTEWDVMSFNTVFKYRLHWWAFTPHQKARKVSEVMLFGNHGIYSTLFIAVCQWPLDYTRVLIYGNCCETYMGSASQAERSYLTITTVPSLNKCQGCLKVAASYEEEDLAANWDSCVRFSCLKHSVTVHSTFDVVSPYPKFDPAVSMKRDGTVVFNTGNQLHVLRAELVYVDGNSPQVAARVDPMVSDSTECLAEPSNSDNTQNKSMDSLNAHELWVEESKSLPKTVNEKCSENQNGPLFSCPYNTRSHSLSPSVSSIPSEKTGECKDGANVSYNASCNLNSTSDKKYDYDEDDLDDEEITTKKGCLELDSKHFSLMSDNKAVCLDSCDMPNKLQCTRNEDGDFDKICVFTKGMGSDGCNISNKKSCDTSKQCDTSSCRSELDAVSVNCKNGKEKVSDDSYLGRVTRSQASRRNIADGSSEEDLEVEVQQYKKYLCPMEDTWGRETHTIDSTQELNISCGTINSYSESSQSTVTLMSPVQKSLLIVGPSEEGRCGQASQSHSDPKHTSSPPRRKMLRSGNPVKFYSSPMPPSQPKVHSKMAAEAEKAYEFTDDIPDTTGEKLSSYRKRRLADKKYEFIEEGEDLENIVPYRLHRRREPTRHRSPPLLISPSPVILNHRRRHHEVDSEDGHFTGQRVSSNMPYNSLSGEIHSSGNHLETDKVVLRPLNQNTSGPILLSPRDRDTVNADRTKTGNNKKPIQSDVVGVAEDLHHSTGVEAGVDNIEQSNMDPENDPGSMPAQCTVQLKRHYIEVDDELISVITDIEDDDVNEGISYHCALPLEVHGAGYVQLQMISNSKAEKLMAPCVMVLQRSFDVEQFCHKIAERLCEESGKKYWFCNDYDVEIVDVCPLSGDVLALAMMRIQATVKTKGLAKSQRHPVSSQQRRQYQGGCHFIWNLDTGDYSVVDTKPLAEVDSTEENDPWNPARDLAKQLRQELPQVPVLHSVRHVSNKPALKGVSATRYEDSDHMIELVLQ
ncbi:hypothetical protein R5R35_011872 [Gryllus longicercus]|uniref:DDB1- and CUL4-associated factor 15 WD40 repeat-containing domain-containing protein n=1 Tax=Gryllus longicercus TaxID=2509291 RepID=A0AAN9W3C4_9ORTH